MRDYARHIAAIKVKSADAFGEQQAEILDLLMHLKIPQEH